MGLEIREQYKLHHQLGNYHPIFSADPDHPSLLQNYKKILDVYALRVNLYKNFADREHDPIIKAIIEAKKSVVMSDMGLLSAQFEIKYNIAKINLRLEKLEKSYSSN